MGKPVPKPTPKVVKKKIHHPHTPIHLVVYGTPGAKKSTLASTFPKPIKVSQFDAFGKDGPYLRLGEWEDGEGDYGTPQRRVFDKKGDLLCEIDYFHDPDPEKPDGWELFRKTMKDFDPSKWATWVGDSITAASVAARYEQQFVINPNVKHPKIWYGGATDQLERHFMRRAASYTCNVVVICHIAEKYSIEPGKNGAPDRKTKKGVELEEGGEGDMIITRSLSAPGRLGRDNGLISQYAEVYRAYVQRDKKGKRQWYLQTEPDETWVAATQIPAPDGSPPEYAALFEDEN